MTALDWVLVVAVVVLGAFVIAGLVLGARALRQLQSDRADAQATRGQAVDDAQAKVADANAKAASVRAEAADRVAEGQTYGGLTRRGPSDQRRGSTQPGVSVLWSGIP